MESSNLAISALVPTCRTHKHYRYYIHDEGRGHGRPGEWEWSESEGPPSGLQRLRPSGSDPGARHLSSRLSLTFSAWKDLRKDIPQSIFEKSNTALLRAVTLKWNKFDLQCATFRVCEECEPFTRLRASIVQPPNFLPMSVMRVWFSMTLGMSPENLDSMTVGSAFTLLYSISLSILHFFDLDMRPEVLWATLPQPLG